MLPIILMLAFAPVQPAPTFADYVLNVPVRIENMPNLSSANLSCTIYHFGATAVDRQALSVGTQANVPLSGGSYTGTITVTVTVSAANALRYTPNTWSCFLNFRWRNPDGTEFNESMASNADRAIAYTRITGQAISENTTEVSGPLPGG
jgi:hypothetical protein